ncbi:MAG: ribonuclease H-like domain-containing protein [Spirochaetes bacterium]|nr:ribonuclease H-like domain-containing protein [Spirochaetota bacterium]
MIDETFTHCPNIGSKTEIKLKEIGFKKWSDCITNQNKLPFKDQRLSSFLKTINLSIENLENNNIRYFVESFKIKEHWRILGRYFDKATFFDIETTGLNKYDNHATVITALKEKKIYTFFIEENLDEFLNLAFESRLLVSFNGNAFDIPFLERTFHIPQFVCPHIDLRWVSYHAGFKSSLKEIERQMNIERPHGIEHIDGLAAIKLYYDWKIGDRAAKEKLIKYCKADTIASYIVASIILNKYGFNIEVDQEELKSLI